MVTAVVLTHNNEKTIEKTLDSLSWCDKCICIDDNSSDRTVEIVKKKKADVYIRALSGDFASQRNFGLEKVKGPEEWVLFVDSDEIVTDALKKEILSKISTPHRHSRARPPVRQESGNPSSRNWIPAQGQNDTNGYFIKRTDVFLGRGLRYGETAHVKLLRLAKKGAGVWIRPVHEYWDIEGHTETLDNPLIHESHTNVAQFIDEINIYSTINARYLYKQGVRSTVFAILAYPTVKFIQNYFFRLGFLDGTRGCIMALMMSFHSFLTRGKLYLLWVKPRSQ